MGGGQVSIFGRSWQSRLYCVVQLGALGVRSVRYWLLPLYAATLFVGQRAEEVVYDDLHHDSRQSGHFSLEVSESALGYQKIISYSGGSSWLA